MNEQVERAVRNALVQRRASSAILTHDLDDWIEAARRQVPLDELLAEMWNPYRENKRVS